MDHTKLIAPCGMDCRLCQAFQGKGLPCQGCGNTSSRKSCQNCSILNCKYKKEFCYECSFYPCSRLKKLDKRYREKYKMSMINNLEFIQKNGLPKFIDMQNQIYQCKSCGKLKTVHQDYCIYCQKKDSNHEWYILLLLKQWI